MCPVHGADSLCPLKNGSRTSETHDVETPGESSMTARRLHVIAIARRSVASLLAGALFASVPLAAQSLGDVARREQSRRETTPKGKVYTNESLPEVTDAPVSVKPASPAAASADAGPRAGGDAAGQSGAAAGGQDSAAKGDGAKGDAKKDDPEKDEKYWRDRMAKAREALARDESFAEALQSRINGLSNDFVNRDDPAQRNVIASNRDKALTELDRVKKEMKEHQKAIEDLRDEARREGVPAGWVR